MRMKSKVILGVVLAMALAGSAYIYWPLLQEAQGRAVDAEMTARTDNEVKAGKIDPTYVEIARATGGGVCAATGSTPEEKAKNLEKCMAAFAHRDLVKRAPGEIRARYLNLQHHMKTWGPLGLIVGWAVLFALLLYRTGNTAAIAMMSAMPSFIFWVTIGGPMAMLDPSIPQGRGGFHLPLIGAVMTAALVFAMRKTSRAPGAPRGAELAAIIASVGVGSIPSLLLLLVAGSC